MLAVVLYARPRTFSDVVGIVSLGLWGLLLTSWLVLPLSAILGLAWPRIVGGRDRARAALVGAALGLVIGFSVGVIFAWISILPVLLGQSTSPDEAAWRRHVWAVVMDSGVNRAIFVAIWLGATAAITAEGKPALARG